MLPDLAKERVVGEALDVLIQAVGIQPLDGGPFGRGGAAGGGRGRGTTATRTPRPDSEYRQLVERWIVPAYSSAPAPRERRPAW